MALKAASTPAPAAAAAAPAAPASTVKKVVKKAAVKKATKKAADKAAPVAKTVDPAVAKEKAAALLAKQTEHETTRRSNAVERITAIALDVATQEARIGEFVRRLAIRVDRSKARLQKAVDEENARQARVAEANADLAKKMKPDTKTVNNAALLPAVELKEEDLPGYITSIKVDEE